MLLPHLLLSVMQLQLLFDVFCWNMWSPYDTSGSRSASAAADLLADTSVSLWLSVCCFLDFLDLLTCPRYLLCLILIHLTLSLERMSSKKGNRDCFCIWHIMPMFIWGCGFCFSFRLVIRLECWGVSVTDRLQSPWNHELNEAGKESGRMESFGDIYSFIPLQYFCFGEDSDFN